MDDVMNRRIERFRSKVQTNINLADDEILRLSNDLMKLQGEVDSVRDELNRVTIKLDQKEQAGIGQISRQQAKCSTKVSRVKTQNENEINEITKQHSLQIAKINKDYRDSLDQLRDQMEEKEHQRTAPLEAELKAIEDQKRGFEKTIRESSDPVLDEDEEVVSQIKSIEYSRLSHLERSIITKNNDRYLSLMSAKQRLSDVVQRLDQMEQDHKMAINSLLRQLQTVEERYKTRISMLQSNNEHEIKRLKNQYEVLKQKEERMQDSIENVQRNQKRQMMAAVQEGEDLKRSVTMYRRSSLQETTANTSHSFTANNYTHNSSYNYSHHSTTTTNITQNYDNDDVKAATVEYQRLKKELEKKENQLIKARTENETLQRELARLKHESTNLKRKDKFGF